MPSAQRRPSTASTHELPDFAIVLPRINDLLDVLETLDDAPIIATLESYRPTGRKGYPLRAFWYAYIASFQFDLGSTNDLIRELEDDAHLRQVCGFDADAPLPDRRSFNRFIRRLGDHADLVEACLHGLTNNLKAILPDLGNVVAIDASVVRSHAKPPPKLDFTHFKRHKRGNLQYDGTVWRGVSVHRSWRSIVKNPPTPTTSSYAQR